MFGNRVMRKILGPKRDEVAGEWRRLHYEELYGLGSSPNIIRVIKKNEMGGACVTCRRQERCVQGFGGKTWGQVITLKTSA
jgi:hypothetical protein